MGQTKLNLKFAVYFQLSCIAKSKTVQEFVIWVVDLLAQNAWINKEVKTRSDDFH